ncbi:MAG: 1-deoxy-D-xylulose-5-phosphate synthase [Firmicutes bacterium]|nr:1-deoxy-D-xylulose-5-phosphate synthase [Bacillota bacterium]
MTLLDTINDPKQLHELTQPELVRLCRDLRERIIQVVEKTGGHLASSLGVVELTVALHSLLNAPADKLVWDVGHQAYAHKLLTGRKDQFHTLRQHKGISGFPARHESVYDAFTVGHSSTAISAALGYALARDYKQEDYSVVAVVGDGALTAGMSFEALNHAGHMGTRLTVVLNDNEMSIAPNVGALSEYLTRLRMDPTLSRTKEEIEQILRRIPAIGDSMIRATDRAKRLVRQLVVPGVLFEELGFTYIGPVDGHDVDMLQKVLKEALRRKGPVLVHVITQKGKGHEASERNPVLYHGAPPAVQANGSRATAPTYSSVFGEALTKLAKEDDKITAITAAMPDGTGLGKFKEAFPERFFDVGIAEQHAVTLAGGLAAGGLKPVVAIYSSFLQRAYDQVIHDVCLPNLPVVLAIDRAGLVGEDGPTHHGVFDVSFLRAVPNLCIMAPKDSRELKQMLNLAFELNTCVALRYPRGEVHDKLLDQLGLKADVPVEYGKAEVICQGSDLTIVAAGSMVAAALEVAGFLSKQGLSIGVINARWIKPLDAFTILKAAAASKNLVTLEENALAGGFGSAIQELLEAEGLLDKVSIRRFGIPDEFAEHGTNELLLEKLGLDTKQLIRQISAFISQEKKVVIS